MSDEFGWLKSQLGEIADGLSGPITSERWDQVWVDTHNALIEEGETRENAPVVADHHVVEVFGPRPEEGA